MDLFTLARIAGVVGGLCWVARFLLKLGGSGSGGTSDLLYLVGAVLVAAALVAGGAGLVSTSATWLRAIVAVAFPLLVWSVLSVLHEGSNPEAIDAALGLGVAVASWVAMSRARRKRRQRAQRAQRARRSRSHGAHAR
jgi:ABC-type nickel/cobalt efflux system permease component RcnA